METVTGQEQAVAQEPARKVSLWEDIVDVFVSPGELFRRQAQASWVKPWLVLSVILVVLYFAFWTSNHDVAAATAQEMFARTGKQLPAGTDPAGGTVSMVIRGIMQPVGVLIGILVGALLLWIAAAVAQGGPRFKQAMMIVAWASVPMILQKVLLGLLVILKSGDLSGVRDTSTGLLRFLDAGTLSIPLISALSLVDVFVFWQVILWLVALRVVCHNTTGKATAVAFATWLMMVPLMLAVGFLSQLMMGAVGG